MKNIKKSNISYGIIIILLYLIFIPIVGCKKFLDIGPPSSSINTDNVFVNDNTAIGVLTAIYAKMSSDFGNSGLTSLSFNPELSADNLVLYNINDLNYLSYYRNQYDPYYLNVGAQIPYWSRFYQDIYKANAAIEGLNNSNSLSPTIKQRLLGEAYFIRALYYFYLVNIYGDVPLAITTDYKTNAAMPRTKSDIVYNQMVFDLKKASDLLDDQYVDASILKISEERVRPNRMAAIALLARVYLYQKKYNEAELAATKIINNALLYEITPLSQVFLKNSKETIWALQPVKNGFNTDEANTFLLPEGPNLLLQPFYLSLSLMNSFEQGDMRKSIWTGTYSRGGNSYPYASKYRRGLVNGVATSNEYTIVLRLAEQYLIRAEARAEQNNISGSVHDLNVIRSRSRTRPTNLIPNPLPDLATNLSISDLRNVILVERRVELFTEYGHRWFDLKRTSTIDQVMKKEAIEKGTAWEPYKALYPIPNTDLSKNPNLIQNPGYN
jgi:hypothetical protein